ncbi:hypothetical protein KUM42_00515 [Modestobacter sp. L9-4]|uniref:hypothetical protein n=1 Tax=Modestobacter sp. L9-4 TaxID=2851567 RepID=UPI001C7403B4|nr:hypothetical protein [Modestobacter sp. L9-4]QXG76102.1 hypothetical protein KUM42_00515 [Modestobacter sp. L9-4]
MLADVARRIERDRGVVDVWRLEARDGALWACYGDLLHRVAGAHADISGPDELFEEIDTWVAFERPGGPGRLLDRDLQAMADWRARLAVQRPRYEAAAARVFLDIASTTELDLVWRIAVHETEVDWSAVHDRLPPEWLGAAGCGGVVAREVDGPDPSPEGPPTRPVDFPQLYLETRTSTGSGSDDVLTGADDLDGAVWDVAGTVQDLVMEEGGGAWPACPGHWHPMQPGHGVTGPVWRCPDDERVAVPIGQLVELWTSGDRANG